MLTHAHRRVCYLIPAFQTDHCYLESPHHWPNHPHTHTHTNHPSPTLPPTILPTPPHTHMNVSSKNWTPDRVGKPPKRHLDMKLFTETQTNEILLSVRSFLRSGDPQKVFNDRGKISTPVHTHSQILSSSKATRHALLFDTCQGRLLVLCQPDSLLLRQANKLAKET